MLLLLLPVYVFTVYSKVLISCWATHHSDNTLERRGEERRGKEKRERRGEEWTGE